jgi:hypothetical protein
MAKKATTICMVLLPIGLWADVICALGPGASSYNAYSDQRPTTDAMQLAGRVNAILTPLCSPKCPVISVFRNATASNAMLVVTASEAKIVYAPKFFTELYDSYGDGAIIAVIAHELGHALDETAPGKWMKSLATPELRADAWAGCALARSGLTIRALTEAVTALSKYPSAAHSSWGLRLTALRLGFSQCGGNPSNFDHIDVANQHG